METHSYTFGIEEEFFLVRPRSRGAVLRMPAALMRQLRQRLGGQVGHELLQSQVETNTRICASASESLQELRRLRQGLADVCAEHGLAYFAAGTHPLGAWREHSASEGARYARLMTDFQIIGRRNLLCGLHVHVAPPPGSDRIRIINRLLPWLPVFLALSTSSPFWHKQRSGLMSYRQAAYDEWPRTGIPDYFVDEAEYRQFVDTLVGNGSMKNASFVWWTVRPSHAYPTIELRIADACTHLDDSLTLAGLFRCLVRAASRGDLLDLPQSGRSRLLIEENRWRAKRYGSSDGFLDYRDGGVVAFRSVLDDLLQRLADDMCALQHTDLPARLERLLARGSSAHQQLALYERRRGAGASRVQALQAVVDWLIAASLPDADGGAAAFAR